MRTKAMKTAVMKTIVKKIIKSLPAITFFSVLLSSSGAFAVDKEGLAEAINGDHRSAENKARDQYRHPMETLTFFGINDNMTVIESRAGGGWYTEVLAPYLRANGKLIATQARKNDAWEAMLDARPDVYDRVERVVHSDGAITQPGTVDAVLDFRNAHGWLRSEEGTTVLLKAWHDALKPGGVVGITDHRQGETPTAGYIKEQDLIDVMAKNGFEFVAKSEINANPKDTKDYPGGVWTLPPNLREGDKNREKYLAIGESDRLTMLFKKK